MPHHALLLERAPPITGRVRLAERWRARDLATGEASMGECCGQAGYQAVFGERFARWIARKYRKHGLDPTQRLMVSFLTDRGIKDASVLEIGGGVGEFQIELLSRGAREATNLEISRGYESQAAALLDRAGMTDRVTRRLVDIATSPEDVEPADVVVLHRVV